MLLHKKISTNYKGFTLVELLVYMGILSILLISLAQIFTSLIDSRLESEATSSVEQDSQYILSKLTYDLHKAQSISDPNAIGSTSATMKLTIDSVQNAYSLQNNNLMVASASSQMMNSYDTTISNLSFTRIGNTGVSGSKDTIKVSFTVTSRVQKTGSTESKSVATTIGIR